MPDRSGLTWMPVQSCTGSKSDRLGVPARLPSGEGCTRFRENNKPSKKLALPVKFGLTAFFVGPINQQQEMKRFFPIFAVAALLLILLVVVRQCGQTNAAKYQTTTITRGPLTEVVTATGTLNPVVNVQVGSQVSGNIQKLFVDFNSEVKAGQVVAQIDPALFQAALTQA
jgi:Biotin-lipoyl like